MLQIFRYQLAFLLEQKHKWTKLTPSSQTSQPTKVLMRADEAPDWNHWAAELLATER